MSAKSNKIGVVQLTILTMVNMMGSGIIMLPTKLAEIGTISIVSWLVTAVGSTALAMHSHNAVCSVKIWWYGRLCGILFR